MTGLVLLILAFAGFVALAVYLDHRGLDDTFWANVLDRMTEIREEKR